MAEFILYVDDTSFNSGDKKSQTLQDEVVTYAGVLINKGLEIPLSNLMSGLGKELNIRYGTTEFHFTDIYNRKPPFQEIKFEETYQILQMFSQLFDELDLKIFVHTSTKNPSQDQQVVSALLNEVSSNLHLPQDEKSQSLLYVYLKAKKYLEENQKFSQISRIVCDEGMRKNGATETIPLQNVSLQFKSSLHSNLLQLADYAAWITTRAKHILDKASAKGALSEVDTLVLQVYSQLAENYVGLPKATVCLDNLEQFDYDDTIKNLKK